jgi:hypothetical protein
MSRGRDLGLWAAAVTTALGACGCSLLFEYPKKADENTRAACTNGLDDDLDGRADCYDPDCATFCGENTAATCSDGVDNDVDGHTDCLDQSCSAFCRESTDATCHDGVDQDLNGRADCLDPTCSAFCQETTEAACKDGRDNDQDGKVDCKDEDCAAFCQETTQAECTDGLDNDGDSKIDCKDDDCKAFCPESNATTCADGVDNDFDGLVDCHDPSCDGFCPEQSAADCSDGRDNDGDGLTDAADARCWPYFPPTVQRCGVAPATEFSERFDVTNPSPPLFGPRWFQFGSRKDASGEPQSIVELGYHDELLTGREDVYAFFNYNTTSADALTDNLGGMATERTFVGNWAGFELSFSALVTSGAALRVALVPVPLSPPDRAPHPGAESSLVEVVLDGSADPPLFALDVAGSVVSTGLPLPAVCGAELCQGGFASVDVRFDSGHLTATFSGPGGSATLTSTSLPSSEFPESRLVVWGGSTLPTGDVWDWDWVAPQLDDLRVRLAATDPCGVPVPQIPFASCDLASSLLSIGQTVSVASDGSGKYCALITASENATASGADRVTTWASSDGRSWAPATAGGGVLALPPGAMPIGAAITHDGNQFVAAVAYTDSGGVRLGLTEGATCANLAALTPGPLLPGDAEAPSYVVTPAGHSIYFTRPPTDRTARSLWRISGADASSLTSGPTALLELPGAAEAMAPVSITRVGASDLVMTYPTEPGVSGSGIGILAGDESGRNWTPLPAIPLFSGTGRGGFDSDGVTSGALVWNGTSGFVLYGGIDAERGAVGTALLSPAGSTPPNSPPAARCGDANCDPGESCESCPADCSCPGVSLLAHPLDSGDAWHTSNDLPAPLVRMEGYVDPETKSLQFGSVPGPDWAFLPLRRPLTGDFELAFDLVASAAPSGSSGHLCDPLLIGLGTVPSTSNQNPIGAFLRVTYATPCFSDTFGLSPFVRTPAAVFKTASYLGFESCSPGFVEASLDERRHVVMARRNGTVVTTVYDARGCPSSESVEYGGALPPLPALLVGYGNVNPNTGVGTDCVGLGGEITNLSLRLPSDPRACSAGEVSCSTPGTEPGCVDTSSSPENCGACGRTCGTGRSCVASGCTCSTGLLECAGQCIDPNTSTTNCGACGRACARFCLVGGCDTGESCASPRALPAGYGTYHFDPSLRSTDLSQICQVGETHDVVFTWQATAVGPVTFDARSSEGGPPPEMGITTDSSCSDFEHCRDLASPNAHIAFVAQAGTTYYIAIGYSGVGSASGGVDLTIGGP